MTYIEIPVQERIKPALRRIERKRVINFLIDNAYSLPRGDDAHYWDAVKAFATKQGFVLRHTEWKNYEHLTRNIGRNKK